jgi:hypothetical protein
LRIRCPECHEHFVAGDPAWSGSSSFVARLLLGLGYWTQAVGVVGGLILVAWGAWMGRERIVVDRARNYTMPAVHVGFALGMTVALALWVLGRRARSEEGAQAGWLSLSALVVFHVGLILALALQRPIASVGSAVVLALPLALILFADPIAGYFEVVASGSHAKVSSTPPWVLQAFGLVVLLAIVIASVFRSGTGPK